MDSSNFLVSENDNIITVVSVGRSPGVSIRALVTIGGYKKVSSSNNSSLVSAYSSNSSRASKLDGDWKNWLLGSIRICGSGSMSSSAMHFDFYILPPITVHLFWSLI